MFPKIPELGALRLATIKDVPRIAVVATAGFFYSPVFEWERPQHAKFPRDTMLSYQQAFAQLIRSPNYAIVVAEDDADANEDGSTNATLARDDGDYTPSDGQRVIVGVGSWELMPHSRREGQFIDPDDDKRVFKGGNSADKDLHNVELLDAAQDKAKMRYFSDHAMMDMLVVHPAYWRRGHGSTLVKWGNVLCEMDGAKIGCNAASTGESLYLRLGFEKLEGLEVRNEDSGRSVYVGFLRRQSRGT